jgi:hypothetical protein
MDSLRPQRASQASVQHGNYVLLLSLIDELGGRSTRSNFP